LISLKFIDSIDGLERLGMAWTGGGRVRRGRRSALMARARRFDPAGDYVRRFVPELAALPPARIHTPWT
jgi:deoxyribodipyrimidine photolyase